MTAERICRRCMWWLPGLVAALSGCRPSDVLSVPPPAGVTASTAYQNQGGAEALDLEGRTQVLGGFAGGQPLFVGSQNPSGVLGWSGLLSDEFTWAYFTYGGVLANVDARITAAGRGFQEPGDQSLQSLTSGRVTLLSAIDALKKYEPPSGRSKIGEAYALVGYAELLMAEDYCAGVPLGRIVAGAGVQYGTPLTTDSLLGVAATDFDSALVYASASDTIGGLASVGLGRARLDRGQYRQAAAAVGAVPTGFVYNATLEAGGASAPPPMILDFYALQTSYQNCGLVNVGDGEGVNGLHFISAGDPRLVLSTTVAKTCDAFAGGADSVWYYPVKFGNPSSAVPLATGVEARLIEAEAALKASQTAVWAADLNTLRASTSETYLALGGALDSLSSDSTTAASPAMQVDVMFRERAFWLYGMGTRLGDMRRLIRQYGRDQGTVFPTGSYPNGNLSTLPAPIPVYGTDVSLTLPTPLGGLADPNPAYKGCLTSTKVA